MQDSGAISEEQRKELEELAERYGTPLYVYYEERISSQYRRLAAALSGLDSMICYAVKANSNIGLLGAIAKMGAGFDIVSEGELRRVVRAGGDPSKVVFSGVGKRESELDFALESGILLFNVESQAELVLLEQRARSTRKRARVALRINPDISVDTHPYLATGLSSSKFGLAVPDALELAEIARRSPLIELRGIDCHIGSQINEIDALREAYTQVLELARKLNAAGHSICYLDLGGGLGVGYSGQYRPLDVEAFGRMLRVLEIGSEFKVIMEPGKFLVAEAGSLLTRVLLVKDNADKRFVVVDAGMNDLIRPALYEAHHHMEPLRPSQKPSETVDVVGPVCESGCYLAKERSLPPLRQGELLLVRDTGAYCFSMASTYNSRRLPAEVLIERGGPRLIRRRDEFEDLWRNEIL